MIVIKKNDVQKEISDKQKTLNLSLVSDNSEEDLRIEVLIRETYTLSQELAIHRKKLMGELSDEEWKKYCAFVKECINKAREDKVE